MRQAWYRMSGVDLTGIDAIGVETIQVVLTEYGPDLSCFPTEKHFVSHATLAPREDDGEAEKRRTQSAFLAGYGRPFGDQGRHPQRVPIGQTDAPVRL